MPGNTVAAVHAALGPDEGDSNRAFAAFDAALVKALAINEDEFDHAIEYGARDLNGRRQFTPVAALVVALLAWLGLRPRLREYEV